MSEFETGSFPSPTPDGGWTNTSGPLSSRWARVVPPAVGGVGPEPVEPPPGRLAAMEASLTEQIIELEEQVLRLRHDLRHAR